ncbi:hypothetical protein [Lewinella sp. LCG006]|uniref:hypothetical protein n=1 Tax=Lewinella sp. LCG006 TaxID=3231911 RepID=UPI00345FC4F5
MSKFVKLFILVVGMLIFNLGCSDSTNLEEHTTVKHWTKEELVELVEQHISEELKQLGEANLISSIIRDTMFYKEYYEREKIINDRNLENKDYRYNQAVSRANEASALLQENPDNEEAKARYQSAQDKINSINRSELLSDSLETALQGLDDKLVYYYELILSYNKSDESNADINFFARVDANGEILKVTRTRIKAESKDQK